MKKVKAILTYFRNSVIPNELFYSKLLHIRFATSLHYFISVIVFIVLCFAAITLIKYNPFVILEYKTSLFEAINTFPPNSIIRINNKILDTMDKKPIMVWMNIQGHKRLLFVANPLISTFSSEQALQSFVLLTSNRMRIQLHKSTYNIPYSLDISITRRDFDLFKDFVEQHFLILSVIFYTFLILSIPAFIIFWAFGSVIASSIIVYLVCLLFQKNPVFRKVAQIGFYSSVLPLCIGAVFFLFLPANRSIPITTILLILIFQAVSVYEAYYSDTNTKKTLKKHRIVHHH